MEDKLKYIAEKLGTEEILCQLAEEAAELSQAALKLRRCISGKNPTPKSKDICWLNLKEEIADVEICMFLISYIVDDIKEYSNTVAKFTHEKLNRWYERLGGK